MRNLTYWAGALAVYIGLFAWGSSERIALQRGTRTPWARFWKAAEAAPVPGAKPKKPEAPRPRPPAPPKLLSLADAEHLIRGSACLQRADSIIPRLRWSIRVSAVPVDDVDDLPKGASRMAAPPDVPVGLQWPKVQRRPMAPLAQLNLSEVAALDEDGLLPKTGWLCFFYALNLDPPANGTQPEDRSAWQVVYFDEPAAGLQRTSVQGALRVEFPPCRVRFWQDWTLPSAVEEPEMVEEYTCSSGFYNDLCGALSGRPKEPGWHHLLGYAQNNGGPMRAICELVSGGTVRTLGMSDDAPKMLAAREHAADWVLLFQVEPDALTELEAKPVPKPALAPPNYRLYFWIRQGDLRAGNFDQVWLLRQ